MSHVVHAVVNIYVLKAVGVDSVFSCETEAHGGVVFGCSVHWFPRPYWGLCEGGGELLFCNIVGKCNSSHGGGKHEGRRDLIDDESCHSGVREDDSTVDACCSKCIDNFGVVEKTLFCVEKQPVLKDNHLFPCNLGGYEPKPFL